MTFARAFARYTSAAVVAALWTAGPGLRADSSIEFEWARQFGSLGPASDIVWAVASDAGGTYVAGGTEGALPGQVNAGGGRDAFVSRYDRDGGLVWARQIGSSQYEEARALAPYEGGVYVVGQATGSLLGQPHLGNTDSFVARYAPDGTLIWVRQFGTPAFDQAFGTAADATGVYVGGRISAFPAPTTSFVRKYDHDGVLLWETVFTTGTTGQGILDVAADGDGLFVGGGAGMSVFGQPTSGAEDAFISRFDPATGAHLWTRQFGTSGFDRVHGLALSGGSVYGGGFFPIGDGFVRAYDRDGTVQWHEAIADGFTTVEGVAADAAGVYVSGHTTASLGAPNAGNEDVFVRAYLPVGGAPLWTAQLGSSGHDHGNGLAADAEGLSVGGFTQGSLGGESSSGSDDGFLARYRPDGALAWVRQFGGFTLGNVMANAVGTDGSAYVAGDVHGVFEGQVSAGNRDAFVRKYDEAGHVLWTRQFGTAESDAAHGVFADADSVYVVGARESFAPTRFVEAFVARLRSGDGVILWTRRFTTQTGSSFGRGASGVSGDGTHIYVVGGAFDVLPGQTTAGAFIRKYDRDGTEVWTQQSDFEFGFADATAVDADHTGAYVAGFASGDYESGVGLEAFVRRYGADGTVIWTRRFGEVDLFDDRAAGISLDPTGVYVVSNRQHAYDGTGPAFVRKLDRDGADVWSLQLGDAGSQVSASAVDADGTHVWVVGNECAPEGPACDAFVRKLDADGSTTGSRFFGTSGWDLARGVSAGSSVVYVTGIVENETETLPGAEGEGSAFVLKIAAPAVVAVAIDIKPGTDENCLNSDGHGVIPVAILSTAEFDATQVDPATVRLDGQGIRVVGKGVVQVRAEDVNGDGLPDLMMQIEDIDGTYDEGDSAAILTGATFGGVQIEGHGSICVVH